MNVDADSFLRVFLHKVLNQSPATKLDAICALTTQHDCVMHGYLLRQHKEEDSMLRNDQRLISRREQQPRLPATTRIRLHTSGLQKESGIS